MGNFWGTLFKHHPDHGAQDEDYGNDEPQFDRGRRIRVPRITLCDQCQSSQVTWRMHEGGWRLFDSVRQHPGNRYVLHTCKTSTDGFEDEPVL